MRVARRLRRRAEEVRRDVGGGDGLLFWWVTRVSLYPPRGVFAFGAAADATAGIGRALTEKLARQGLNVVMVALDDAMLKDTHALLSNKYPSECRRPGPLCVRRLTAFFAQTCNCARLART